jgi:hypothetical protein
MTAGLLNWPQCTFAAKLNVDSEGKVNKNIKKNTSIFK